MRYHTLAFVLCFFVPPVVGQSSTPLRLGQRVWIRPSTTSGTLEAGVKGTVEGMTGDSLRIRPTPGAPAVSVEVGPRTRLFLFTGRKSSTNRGAFIGGGIGVLVGAIIGYVAGDDCSTNATLCFGSDVAAGTGAMGGGLVGAVGGAILGALSSHDTWARIGWNGAVHPVVAPSPRGLGLGVLLAF